MDAITLQLRLTLNLTFLVSFQIQYAGVQGPRKVKLCHLSPNTDRLHCMYSYPDKKNIVKNRPRKQEEYLYSMSGLLSDVYRF